MEIKNAINNGVSFLTYQEHPYESFVRSIGSANKEFSTVNWLILAKGSYITISKDNSSEYDVNATNDKIFYTRYYELNGSVS